jgi:hypothetical protein
MADMAMPAAGPAFASDLLAPFTDFQLELPAFVGREQVSELVPGHFAPVDHQHRRTPIGP